MRESWSTPYSGEISSLSSASCAFASASVPPSTAQMPGRITICSGRRPYFATRDFRSA